MHKLVYISLIFALFSCEKEVAAPLGHEFDLDVRFKNAKENASKRKSGQSDNKKYNLIADSMGYYHLRLSDSWQTLHRISGKVSAVSNSYDLTKIYWESSHHWYLGDTLGYIVHLNNTINDIYIYSTVDTSYITWFDGFEVPTINETSYSTEDGEFNIMFAPVRSMLGDTVDIASSAEFADGFVVDSKLKIILE